MAQQAFAAESLFDGTRLHHDCVLIIDGPCVAQVVPQAQYSGTPPQRLGPGTLCPGFVDLQVNGGGGVMLNNAPDRASVAQMAQAHARLGATAILPTLITDTPETTRAAINAVRSAVAHGDAGVVGLHLEGPHLSVARKGAHQASYVRAMTEDDLALYCQAATDLPCLKITVAPESVTPEQISQLVAAGVVVSLGHSDCDFDTAMACFSAGARCATHLFNAMSPLSSRAPGLVGAALYCGAVDVGVIADGHHVHPATLALALRAKAGPGQAYLVSDAMAVAGTDLDGFTLNDRWIDRKDGRLTLADGTLAGADLPLARAIQICVQQMGLTMEQALAMATSIPARVIGQTGRLGALTAGAAADFVLLDPAYHVAQVWQGGVAVF